MGTKKRPVVKACNQKTPKRQNVKRAKAIDEHERERKILSESEIEALLAAARKERFGLRNYAILLLMLRYGFRVSELASLRCNAVDLDTGRICFKQAFTHPLLGDELRTLRAYLRSRNDGLQS